MAPIIAALLANGLPLLAQAVTQKGQQLVEEKLGVKLPNPGTALPEDFIGLRELEQREAESLRNWLLETTRVELADVADARKRDAAFLAAGTRNYRADAMILVSWGLVIAVTWAVWRDGNLSEFTKATISLILGRALGYIDQAFQFEFGSTRTSKTKDATIERLAGGDK
jgi:hypothetical protein